MIRPNEAPSNVLVVEDDPDHAALIEAAFHYRSTPWNFHVAGSSEEASAYLRGDRPLDDRRRYPLPDIIILDLGLPGVGGLEFLRWLAGRDATWSETPVIVVTANREATVAAQAVALGAREVKTKPADFNKLVDTVSELVRRWRPATISAS